MAAEQPSEISPERTWRRRHGSLVGALSRRIAPVPSLLERGTSVGRVAERQEVA